MWALWSDPAAWPAFYPGLGSVQARAEFKTGVPFTLIPARGGRRLRYEVVAVEEGRSFTLRQKVLLASLTLQHRLEPCELGCRIHLRIELEGPLAWLHVLLRGRAWKAAVPQVLRALAKAAQRVQV